MSAELVSTSSEEHTFTSSMTTLMAVMGVLNGVPSRHPSTLLSKYWRPCQVVRRISFAFELSMGSWGGCTVKGVCAETGR